MSYNLGFPRLLALREVGMSIIDMINKDKFGKEHMGKNLWEKVAKMIFKDSFYASILWTSCLLFSFGYFLLTRC